MQQQERNGNRPGLRHHKLKQTAYYKMSESSESSSSSPHESNNASTIIQNKHTQAKLEAKRLDQLKFHKLFNDSSKPNNESKKSCRRCTCSHTHKQFNCIECTQLFPIQVRRSGDGESGIVYSNLQTILSNNNETNNPNNHQPKTSDQFHLEEYSTTSSTFSKNNERGVIHHKPSSFKTLSPTLVSILALSKPNNTFIPPPNISLSMYSKNSDNL